MAYKIHDLRINFESEWAREEEKSAKWCLQ